MQLVQALPRAQRVVKDAEAGTCSWEDIGFLQGTFVAVDVHPLWQLTLQDHPLSKPEVFVATMQQRWFNSNLKESLSAA
eukprot:6838709-Prorocentrum_lima.AAC.1